MVLQICQRLNKLIKDNRMLTNFWKAIRINNFSYLKPDQKIMIFASSPVGFPVFKTLISNFPKSQLSVVTHYSSPKQRILNEVEILCKQSGIKNYFPAKKGQTAEQRHNSWQQFENQVISEHSGKWPDFGIVCSYGYIIPKTVIQRFNKGAFLAHPSLVPKYRGGSPIFHAIANGQKQSGVSFMSISPQKFDHGNILYQVTHPLGENDTYQKVEDDLSNLAAEHIMHVIDNFDKLSPGIDQSQIDVSSIPPQLLTSPIIRNKKLDINMPAQTVYNWSRALIVPRVVFKEQQIIVNFQKKFQEDCQNLYAPGQLVMVGRKLYMKCSDRLLQLCSWQQLKKKPLPIHTFINRFIGDRKTYENDLFLK